MLLSVSHARAHAGTIRARHVSIEQLLICSNESIMCSRAHVFLPNEAVSQKNQSAKSAKAHASCLCGHVELEACVV